MTRSITRSFDPATGECVSTLEEFFEGGVCIKEVETFFDEPVSISDIPKKRQWTAESTKRMLAARSKNKEKDNG